MSKRDGIVRGQGLVLVPECSGCDWRPPLSLPVPLFRAHCQSEHGQDEVRLNLVAVCDTCDATMTFAESRPTGGGLFDYFTCACGNRGRVFRDKSKTN